MLRDPYLKSKHFTRIPLVIMSNSLKVINIRLWKTIPILYVSVWYFFTFDFKLLKLIIISIILKSQWYLNVLVHHSYIHIPFVSFHFILPDMYPLVISYISFK